MAFVLDASVAGCWAFDDEDHPIATKARDRSIQEEIVVPALWRFEICNFLIMNERRGRIAENAPETFLALLNGLRISVDSRPNEPSMLSLSRRHRLTVYDAAYLELAMREALPLATLDAALARAAKREDVAILE